MKQWWMLVLFCCACIPAPAQNKLMGFVKLQSSGKTPLANVEVYALGAPTTYTDDKGFFELSFNSRQAGDIVAGIECALEGYMVINEDQLHTVTIPKDPAAAPVQVVMSSKRQFREQKARFYGIVVENTEQVYQKQNQQLLAQLQRLTAELEQLQKDAGERAIVAEERQILLRQLDNLQQQKDQVIANAERIAQLFAEIDTDAASDLGKQALELFESGRVNQAIALLDEKMLREDLNAAIEGRAFAQKLNRRADSLLRQTILNFVLKARFCAANLQPDEALQNYQWALRGDSTHFLNLVEVANFCSDRHQQQQAIFYFHKAINYAPNEAVKAAVSSNLGMEYRYDRRPQRADSFFRAALDTFRTLQQKYPATYLPYSARVLNNLGLLCTDQNNFSEAGNYLQQALEIRKQLAQADPEHKAELASTYFNLGIYYGKISENDSAKLAYQAALQLYEELTKQQPGAYQLQLIRVNNNLANLLAKEEAYAEAKKVFEHSLAGLAALPAENQQFFAPETAALQNNLGFVCYRLQQADSARQAYASALELYRQLAASNPRRYAEDVGMIQFNRANLLMHLGETTAAELAYLESLDIYRQTAEEKSGSSVLAAARTALFLGLYYLEFKQEDKAFPFFQEVLEWTAPYRQVPLARQLQEAVLESLEQLTNYRLQSGQFTAATESVEAGLKTKPDHPGLLSLKVVLLLFQDQFTAAEAIVLEQQAQQVFINRLIQTIDRLESEGIKHPGFDKIRESIR